MELALFRTNTSRRLIWFDEADYWMRRTSRIGPNASSCATSGQGVVSRRRPRGARPSMTDRLLCRRDEIRTTAGPTQRGAVRVQRWPVHHGIAGAAVPAGVSAAVVPEAGDMPNEDLVSRQRVTGFPHDAATAGSGRRVS